jgi:hypothetical protein
MAKTDTIEAFRALLAQRGAAAVAREDVSAEWLNARFAAWGITPSADVQPRSYYAVVVKATVEHKISGILARSRADVIAQLQDDLDDVVSDYGDSREVIIENVEFTGGKEDVEPTELVAPASSLTLSQLRELVRETLLDANCNIGGQYICDTGMIRELAALGLPRVIERKENYAFTVPIAGTAMTYTATYRTYSVSQAHRMHASIMQKAVKDDGAITVDVSVPRELFGEPTVKIVEKR